MSWVPPTLQTPRLTIRPLFESDLEEVFAICSNPRMTRFTLWETHRTPADTEHFLRVYRPSRYREQIPEPVGVALRNSPGQPLVGTLGGFWVSEGDAIMEVGYNIAEPHWGHGYATEATRALIDYLFAAYIVERLQLRVLKGNDASERVARKLGFTHEGVLRSSLVRQHQRWDISVHSMLRAEWVALKG